MAPPHPPPLPPVFTKTRSDPQRLPRYWPRFCLAWPVVAVRLQNRIERVPGAAGSANSHCRRSQSVPGPPQAGSPPSGLRRVPGAVGEPVPSATRLPLSINRCPVTADPPSYPARPVGSQKDTARGLRQQTVFPEHSHGGPHSATAGPRPSGAGQWRTPWPNGRVNITRAVPTAPLAIQSLCRRADQPAARRPVPIGWRDGGVGGGFWGGFTAVAHARLCSGAACPCASVFLSGRGEGVGGCVECAAVSTRITRGGQGPWHTHMRTDPHKPLFCGAVGGGRPLGLPDAVRTQVCVAASVPMRIGGVRCRQWPKQQSVRVIRHSVGPSPKNECVFAQQQPVRTDGLVQKCPTA